MTIKLSRKAKATLKLLDRPIERTSDAKRGNLNIDMVHVASIKALPDGNGAGNRRWSLKGKRLNPKGIVSWRAKLDDAHSHEPIIDDRAKPMNSRPMGKLAKSAVKGATILQTVTSLKSPQTDSGKLKVEHRVHIEHIAGLTNSARRIERRLKAALAAGNTDKAAKLAALLHRQSEAVKAHAKAAQEAEQLTIGQSKRSPGIRITAGTPVRPIMSEADQAEALGKLGKVRTTKKGHTFQRS